MKSHKIERIGLFGGTFDPVHQGHLEIAAHAQESLQLDRLFFIPCRQSPLKESSALATSEQRVEMLRMATADFSWAEIEDWELTQERPNYSWKTVEHFRARFPEGEFFWLMGEDQWETIRSWNRADYFLSLITAVVHGRGDFELTHGLADDVVFLDGDHPASATLIRERLAAGKELPSDWLLPAVSDFITKNHIYQGE